MFRFAFGLMAMGALAVAATKPQSNVIRNGDFEEMQANWEVPHPQTGTISFEKDGGDVGPAFARLSPTNSVSPKYFYIQQYADDTPPGEYIARVHFRLGEEYAARMPTFYVNLLKPGGGGTNQSYQLTLPTDTAPGKWTIVEKDVTIPAGTKRIYFQITVPGSMGYVDVDGLELSPRPSKTPGATQPGH